MSLPVKLIVGLGNPAPNYGLTRHNVGFWFVDALAKKFLLCFSSDKKFNSEVCRYQKTGVDCWLCKPQTYMNKSGIAVQIIASYYKIPIEKILIVHDDIDLEPGVIRLKKGGGHSGHNGLRDIIHRVGSNDFLRLRIGVGHPGDKDKVVSYVLGHASAEEEGKIVNSFLPVLERRNDFFRNDLNGLMTTLNHRNKI